MSSLPLPLDLSPAYPEPSEDTAFTLEYVTQFSPRSKEACKRQGIELTDLVYRPREQFTEDLPAIQEARFEHANRRRRDLLELVRTEHEHLVAINWKPQGNRKVTGFIVNQSQVGMGSPKSSKIKSPVKKVEDAEEQGRTESSQLKLEQQRLEKMLLRQQKELEQMVSYEIKIAELNQKQEEKLALRKQYEEDLREQQRQHRIEIENKKVCQFKCVYLITASI